MLRQIQTHLLDYINQSTFAKMPTGCFCCASACVFHNWLQVINVPYLCGFRSWNTMRSVCSSCKPLAMSSAIVTMSSSGSASPAKYRDKRHNKLYLPGMFLHDKTSMMWGMRVNKHALSLCVIRKNASSLSTGARKYDLIILRLRPSMHIATAKVSSSSGYRHSTSCGAATSEQCRTWFALTRLTRNFNPAVAI